MTAVLLGYQDLPAARLRFVDALGFTEEWCAQDDDDVLIRVHVRLGDTLLMLGLPGAHGIQSPASLRGQTHLVIVEVEDVEAHHARAVTKGLQITSPPTARPWGHDYELRDPEGYEFSFFGA